MTAMWQALRAQLSIPTVGNAAQPSLTLREYGNSGFAGNLLGGWLAEHSSRCTVFRTLIECKKNRITTDERSMMRLLPMENPAAENRTSHLDISYASALAGKWVVRGLPPGLRSRKVRLKRADISSIPRPVGCSPKAAAQLEPQRSCGEQHGNSTPGISHSLQGASPVRRSPRCASAPPSPGNALPSWGTVASVRAGAARLPSA